MLITFFAYSNTFHGEFQFDDRALLSKFSRIKGDGIGRLSAALDIISRGNRPVVSATFALNYIYGGLNVTWYHMTNLLIHVASGLLVYHFVQLTLRSPKLPGFYRGRANVISLAAAALFLLHPIQTQAVSYISQRYESMSSFFYLGALVTYIRAVTSGKTLNSALFYAASILCFFLGLGSKEIALTVPAVMMLYDIYFLPDRPVLKRVAAPAALMIASAVAAVSILSRLKSSISVGFGVRGVTPWEYLLTQFKGITLYIRLLVFPVNQNLDYDLAPSKGLLDPYTAVCVLFIVALIAAAVLGHRRWRLASFFTLWFFIVLSPTSSVVPVVDFVYEHRMYLASVGMFVIASVAFSGALAAPKPIHRNVAVFAAAALLVLLASATYARNMVWKSPAAMWEDVTEKSPNKARGYNNLGNSYFEVGSVDKAIYSYRKALELNPKHVEALVNIGTAYLTKGQVEKGKEAFKTALKVDPRNPIAHFHLGNAYKKSGLLDKAAEEYRTALRLNPSYYKAHYELGVVYFLKNERGKAKEEFKRVLRIRPDHSPARQFLDMLPEKAEP